MAISPPIRAHGRSLADFDELLPAEQMLLSRCRRGDPAEVSPVRPEELTDDNHVRAAFVRFLALGGDERAPVHEAGVRVEGAWISGELNLEGATISHRLALISCRLERVDVGHALLRGLRLDGSLVADRLIGDRLHCSGDLWLGRGFQCEGPITFFGAAVDGDIDFEGAALEGNDGPALSLDRATIGGSLFLRSPFRACGSVSLVGAVIREDLDCSEAQLSAVNAPALDCDRAKIGGSLILRRARSAGMICVSGTSIEGDLDCDGGTFDGSESFSLRCERSEVGGSVFLGNGFRSRGRVQFFGATVRRDFDCRAGTFENVGGDALSCSLCEVSGTLVFTDVAVTSGGVDISAMKAAVLVDDLDSWKRADHVILDGFTYGQLAGPARRDAASRCDWLRLQPPNHLGTEFKPQPWDQLAETLRIDAPREARIVAIAKERELRRAGAIVSEERVLHWLYGALLGYGHRPWRLIRIMVAVWLICAAIYWAAINPRWFGSETPLIVPTQSELGSRRADGNFVPLIYSLDVLLPVVSLGEEDSWKPVVAPRGTRQLLGWLVKSIYWFEIVFGWIGALQLLAVLARLVKPR